MSFSIACQKRYAKRGVAPGVLLSAEKAGIAEAMRFNCAIRGGTESHQTHSENLKMAINAATCREYSQHKFDGAGDFRGLHNRCERMELWREF